MNENVEKLVLEHLRSMRQQMAQMGQTDEGLMAFQEKAMAEIQAQTAFLESQLASLNNQKDD